MTVDVLSAATMQYENIAFEDAHSRWSFQQFPALQSRRKTTVCTAISVILLNLSGINGVFEVSDSDVYHTVFQHTKRVNEFRRKASTDAELVPLAYRWSAILDFWN